MGYNSIKPQMLLQGVHSTDQSSQCVEQTRALNPLHQLEGSHHHQHQADEVHEDTKEHCAESINDWGHPLWKRKALSPKVVATFSQNLCCSSQRWLLTFVSVLPSSRQQLFFKSWFVKKWNVWVNLPFTLLTGQVETRHEFDLLLRQCQAHQRVQGMPLSFYLLKPVKRVSELNTLVSDPKEPLI